MSEMTIEKAKEIRESKIKRPTLGIAFRNGEAKGFIKGWDAAIRKAAEIIKGYLGEGHYVNEILSLLSSEEKSK